MAAPKCQDHQSAQNPEAASDDGELKPKSFPNVRFELNREGVTELVPDAVAIARRDLETIAAWRRPGVSGDTTRARIYPVRVQPLQLVAELHTVLSNKTQRRKLELHLLHSCRQPQVRFAI